MAPRHSGRIGTSAAWLAWVWLGVVAYASLYPFADWHWPRGMGTWEVFSLRWPRYFIPFDITSNLLGYLPLGLLVALALLRLGAAPLWAFLSAVGTAAVASYGLEVLQHLLPPRVPSLLDWCLNVCGAALGGALACLLHWLGWLSRWQGLRQRLLEREHPAAMALLLLWPVALLFPTPVPMGLGQVLEPLRDGVLAMLADVPWADGAVQWLQADAVREARLSRPGQLLVVLLGVLGPGLLAFATARGGWRRLWLVLGVGVSGVGASSLSTALNFGPDHALAWLTPPALGALTAGLLLNAALWWLSRRMAAAWALLALAVMVSLVNLAPGDPYLAQSLQAWEQGQFIRFHGAAQWAGWLWPFGAMAWLLVFLGRREEPFRPGR